MLHVAPTAGCITEGVNLCPYLSIDVVFYLPEEFHHRLYKIRNADGEPQQQGASPKTLPQAFVPLPGVFCVLRVCSADPFKDDQRS